MNTHTKTLLSEIDCFIATRKMAASTFGRLSVNDGKFVARLRGGGRVWPETADKVREYIHTNTKQAAE